MAGFGCMEQDSPIANDGAVIEPSEAEQGLLRFALSWNRLRHHRVTGFGKTESQSLESRRSAILTNPG
jgi:hypothetical protein